MSTRDTATPDPPAVPHGVHVINRADGVTGGEGWAENFQGSAYAAGISVIQTSTDRVGAGPRLHQHPYPETFIIRRGQALFTVGSEELVGSAGQILVVPANTPHKFQTLGPDRFESINIHASDEFITEWLEPDQ